MSKLSTVMAQQLLNAGIVTEEGRVVPGIRRHKPNRRPTAARRRQAAAKRALEAQN